MSQYIMGLLTQNLDSQEELLSLKKLAMTF